MKNLKKVYLNSFIIELIKSWLIAFYMYIISYNFYMFIISFLFKL